MGTGADDQGDAAGMRKIVRRRGFALANLIDGPLWKEVFLDTSSIVGTLFCIKGVGSLISVGGWADIWCQLLADKDPHTVYVVGSIMVLLLVYWVPATLYTLVDLFRPACLYKYKVQAPDSQFPLSTSALLNTIALVLFNQVSMGLVGCEVSWWLRYRWVNMDTPLHVLPSFPRMMAELMAFLVIFDTLFYYCHRLLHTRNFYKYHKNHHTWRAPIAAATAYGHPVDFFLHCVLPVALGPILVRSHLSTTWLWYLVISLHEINDHSGFHFPWFRSPQAHDYHHKVGAANYGNFSRVLDTLHGTDIRYRESGEDWDRHRRLLSFNPMAKTQPVKKVE